MKQLTRIGTLCLCVSFLMNLLSATRPAQAAVHQFYDASVEISDSLPAAPCNWTFDMMNVQAIQPGGYLTITPQVGEFTIPVGTTFTDLDLSIGGLDQPLSATPGTGAGSAWGVTVVPGQTGSFTLTNNDTDTVAPDSRFIIEIGTQAAFGLSLIHISEPTRPY